MDDVGLVTAVQSGDEEALADLFEECHGWAYSTCLNALRDTDAAEEATGRVFEIVIKTRLAGATALRPAMIRLIYDACIEVEHELLRRRWRRRRGEQPPAAPDPHDLRLVAWRAAGDLTGPDRILFALAAGAGFTSESIAAAVAPDKPATVSKRLESIREHVVADIVAARSLDDCPDLRDTLRYAAKEPDHAARRRINAHLTGGRKVPACPKCAATRDRWPLAALAALLPLTAVPPGANDRLLDRMELALRAGLAAGTDRVRAVRAGPDATEANVIDGSMAVDSEPEPPARPARTSPRANPTTAAGATAATATATATDARPADDRAWLGAFRGEPEPTDRSGRARPTEAPPPGYRPTPLAEHEAAGRAAAATPPTGPRSAGPRSPGAGTPEPPAASPGPAGVTEAADPAAAPSPRSRNRKVATGITLAAAVTVLSAAVIALGGSGGSGTTARKLLAEPSGRAGAGPSATAPEPVASTASPLPRPSASVSRQAEEDPETEDSPSAAASPPIQAVLRTVAPSKPADPFANFGTLTVVSPDPGSTVGLEDVDARLANVTLAVSTPDGFDSALLDSTLSWSGTYLLQGVAQDVELGVGQSINVDLPAAPRCTTLWTITATLTPPFGDQQQATTTVRITC